MHPYLPCRPASQRFPFTYANKWMSVNLVPRSFDACGFIVKISGNEIKSQVAQARYMSTIKMAFALFRNSIDLHIYKDLYGEINTTEKNEKLTIELQ